MLLVYVPVILWVTLRQIYTSTYPRANPSHLHLYHPRYRSAVMAETAGQRPQNVPDELEEPHQVHLTSPARTSADTSAREATELARIRSNYTRTSSYRQAGSSTASAKPDGLLECFIYAVKVFWRRQISITVAHSTCRDHLGMYPLTIHVHPPPLHSTPISLCSSILGESQKSDQVCCLIGNSGVVAATG